MIVSSGNKKVPRLRFPGFSDAWEEKKIDDFGDVITGSTPPTNDRSNYGNEYDFISPGDMNNGRYVKNSKVRLSKKGFLKSRQIIKGSTLFVCIGSTIGKIAQASKYSTTNQQINSVVANMDNVDDFVYLVLLRNASRIKRLSGEQAVPLLSKSDFSKAKVFAPSRPEQTKIAGFLGVVDDKISALQQRKELLQKYKKGVMQRIFSQQMRFKDENGQNYLAWREKLGREVFKSVSNRNNGRKLPILAITQDKGAVPRDQINYDIYVTEASVDNYKIVRRGDFIISLRSFQGGIEYSDYDGICSPAYIILRSVVPIDIQFYKCFLKTSNYIQRLTKKLEGIRDGKMISFKYFSDVFLPYPQLNEQQKIGEFLTSIDKKIEAEERKLEQAKRFKKALLQQMFV